MRQAGETKAIPGSVAPPKVSAATGLGTGGGASVQSELADEGRIVLVAGGNASVGGSVTLKFAAIPPSLFIGAHDGFGAVSVAGQGTTTVTLTWTAKLAPGVHHMTYEWAARA